MYPDFGYIKSSNRSFLIVWLVIVLTVGKLSIF